RQHSRLPAVDQRAVPFLFYSGYDDAHVCDKWPGAIVVIKPTGEQVLIAALFDLIRRYSPPRPEPTPHPQLNKAAQHLCYRQNPWCTHLIRTAWARRPDCESLHFEW